MKITIRLLLVLLSLSGVSACAEAGSDSALTPDRTDRNGLIEYAVPPGWNNNDSSSGRHFKRDDPAEDQAMIYIEALAMPPSLTIDDIWSGTQGKHEIQNQVLIEENTTSMNGFEVREAVYEAEVRGQKVVYHDMFLFQDSLQVQMSLNAARDVYDSYLGDFRAAVGSVRPLSEGD